MRKLTPAGAPASWAAPSGPRCPPQATQAATSFSQPPAYARPVCRAALPNEADHATAAHGKIPVGSRPLGITHRFCSAGGGPRSIICRKTPSAQTVSAWQRLAVGGALARRLTGVKAGSKRGPVSFLDDVFAGNTARVRRLPERASCALASGGRSDGATFRCTSPHRHRRHTCASGTAIPARDVRNHAALGSSHSREAQRHFVTE